MSQAQIRSNVLNLLKNLFMENGVQNKLLTFFLVSLSSTFFAEEYEKQTWFGDPNLQGVWTNASLTTLERPDYFETLEISEEAVLAAKKSSEKSINGWH